MASIHTHTPTLLEHCLDAVYLCADRGKKRLELVQQSADRGLVLELRATPDMRGGGWGGVRLAGSGT